MSIIKQLLQHYNKLSLDNKVTYRIIFILSVVAFLTGAVNQLFGLSLEMSIINYFGGTLGIFLILLDFYIPKPNLIKSLFTIGIYIIAITGWFYNSAIYGPNVIFLFSIIIYSIGIFNSNYFLYYLLNFLIFASLSVVTLNKPELIKYGYENEKVHVIDILCTYFLLGLSILVVIRTILNSYKEAKTISDIQKRKLEIREKEFESIVENSPDMIVRFDANFKYLYFNKTVEKAFKIKIEKYLGKTEYDINGKNERSEFIINALEKAKELKSEIEVERSLNMNSVERYYQTRIVPEYDENLEIISFLAVTRDITSHKITENNLRQSEIKFRTSLNISPLPMALNDNNQNITFLNKAFTETFGYTIDDIPSLKEWWQKAYPDPEYSKVISDEWNRELVNSKNNGTPFKPMMVKVITKNNLEKTVLAFATFFEDHFEETYLVALYDITEQTKYEKALQDINELLSLFIKNSPIHAYIKRVTQEQSYVLFASDVFQDMIGYNGSEIVGKNMYELFPEEFAKKITEDDWRVVNKNEIIKIDENFKGRFYTTYKFPIGIGSDKLLAGYTIDITDRIESSTIISEQNAELKKLNIDKDNFMSILAHDLKNPFNSLLGISDLLLKNIRDYSLEKIEKQVKAINKTSHSTFNLLDDLLLWSRSQSGKLPFEPKSIMLSEVFDDILNAIKVYADEKSITINSFGNDLIAFADINMLKTIVRNLLSNAIKFTGEGGRISIYSVKEGKEIVTSVLDNGIGISAENINKLWKSSEYFTTVGTSNEKGSGIGLKLCKDFVEKNGGKIWVETELNKGCEFKFTLPLGRISY